MNIKGKGKPCSFLDMKRFYLRGYVFEDTCEKCGKALLFDGDDDYIRYPELPVVTIPFYCECDHQQEKQVEVSFTLRVKELV